MILSINEHVASMLGADTSISQMVGGRMFPIASIEEVAFPLIVYSRDYVTPMYDKSDKQVVETAVSIFVAADSYSESLDIAEKVVAAVNKKTASYTGYKVVDSRLSSANEDYNNGAYVQTLTFVFTIKEQ